MEENRIREHYVFFGRVQGVGFRYRAKYVANGLRITGWVRNDWDGTVEMEAQGTLEQLNAQIDQSGNLYSSRGSSSENDSVRSGGTRVSCTVILTKDKVYATKNEAIEIRNEVEE